MNLAIFTLTVVAILTTAYYSYGRLLARLLRLDPTATTPANELRDDDIFVPTEPKFLLSQHFSAIAAAGPIVGPITAGLLFGWLPALVWILVGSILIGGVHDLAALTASVRHKARSIAEVVREHMSHRSYLLFLTFIWIALVYIIVAFTDVTASSFVGQKTLDSGESVAGASIASSSLMYLTLPIMMGLLMHYARLPLNLATAIFVPLILLSIYAGQFLPVNLELLFPDTYSTTEKINAAQKTWDILLLVYCLVAGMMPVWMLLQPRGHLGGYFLWLWLLVVVGLFSVGKQWNTRLLWVGKIAANHYFRICLSLSPAEHARAFMP